MLQTGEDLLWGTTGPSDRGPRPGLSRRTVVRAAVDIADADGLEGLSMQRLAVRLGVGTMSLYRHVPGKDELVALMLDEAIGEPPEPPDADPDADPDVGADTSWRAALRGWAVGNREVFVRHPWTLPLVTRPRLMGPHETAWTEAGLRVITRTGLPPADLFDVLLLVNGYVRGAAATDVAPPSGPDRETLMRFDALDRYPTLASVMNAATSPTGFEFGLDRVLDGIEQYVTSTPEAHGQSGSEPG